VEFYALGLRVMAFKSKRTVKILLLIGVVVAAFALGSWLTFDPEWEANRDEVEKNLEKLDSELGEAPGDEVLDDLEAELEAMGVDE
jgi:hypothetical protein